LTGNSAGLRTVLPVVFHTENYAVHSGRHKFSSVYLPTPRKHYLKTLTKLTRKLTHLMGNLCCTKKHTVQFFLQFFTQFSCTYEMKNQQMSLFQFYSYIDGSLHVSGPQVHLQESSHSCSHNHWFSVCTVQVACTKRSTAPERYRH
jgi:hypothetical protein